MMVSHDITGPLYLQLKGRETEIVVELQKTASIYSAKVATSIH